jgi:hypothetical protein
MRILLFFRRAVEGASPYNRLFNTLSNSPPGICIWMGSIPVSFRYQKRKHPDGVLIAVPVTGST